MIMSEMTPRERVLSLIKTGEADVCAAINPTSVATRECMRVLGLSSPGIHTNASDMAALAATSHTILGFDSVMPYFSVHLEADMLGCEVDWTRENMPAIIQTPLKSPDDFRLPKNFLSKSLARQLLSAIKQLKLRFGDEVAIIGKVMGPWSLMYNLYGVGNLLLDTIINPEKIHYFIRQLLPISIQFAHAQFEAGADIVTWADHVTADIISKKIYEEFVLPIHKEANSKFSADEIMILHTCGNVMDRLDLICSSGFELFHIDSRNNIEQAVQLANGRIQLTGAINNPITLVQGNKRTIEQQVKYCASSGIKLISPECAIPLNVSNQSLVSLTRSVHSIKCI